MQIPGTQSMQRTPFQDAQLPDFDRDEEEDASPEGAGVRQAASTTDSFKQRQQEPFITESQLERYPTRLQVRSRCSAMLCVEARQSHIEIFEYLDTSFVGTLVVLHGEPRHRAPSEPSSIQTQTQFQHALFRSCSGSVKLFKYCRSWSSCDVPLAAAFSRGFRKILPSLVLSPCGNRKSKMADMASRTRP